MRYLPPLNEVCEGYVFTGVCSVHMGGVSAPLHAGIHTPQADTPWQTPTPSGQTPPRKTPPGRHPPPLGRHPPPLGRHPPPSGQAPLRQTPPGRHPPPLGRYPLADTHPIWADTHPLWADTQPLWADTPWQTPTPCLVHAGIHPHPLPNA